MIHQYYPLWIPWNHHQISWSHHEITFDGDLLIEDTWLPDWTEDPMLACRRWANDSSWGALRKGRGAAAGRWERRCTRIPCAGYIWWEYIWCDYMMGAYDYISIVYIYIYICIYIFLYTVNVIYSACIYIYIYICNHLHIMHIHWLGISGGGLCFQYIND